MNTEARNNNSPPNQEDEDRPLSSDVDFSFEEPVEVEHRDSCFRLTPQFSAGPNAMAKTSERVDRERFRRVDARNSKRYATFDLQGRHQVCSVESVWHGRRPCLRFGADKSGSGRKKALNFTKDAGEDEEVDIFPFPVFGQIINIPRQARNFKPLARLTQGNRVHGASSSPTCALLWSMRSTGWPFCIKTN